MDVTCERCGTVYEFDETLLSGRGTTVKCTQCEHIFKVMPPGAAGGAGWQVRRANGRVESLSSLKELQHRIAAGLLAPDDVISRDGESWKRLGDIAELQSFFAVGQTARAATPPPKREHQKTEVGVGSVGDHASPPEPAPSAPEPATTNATPTAEAAPAETTEAPAPAPQGGRTHKPTLVGMGTSATDTSAPTVVAGDAPKQPQEPPGEPPAGSQDATVPSPSRASDEPPSAGGWTEGPGLPASSGGSEGQDGDAFADTVRAIEPQPSPQAPRRSVPTVEAAPRPPATRPDRHAPPAAPAAPESPAPRRPRYVDEDEEGPKLPGGRRKWGWLLVAVLLIGAGGGVWLAWPRISERLGTEEPEDPIVPFLDRAAEALAGDHRDAYAEAVREYTRATALDENDPRVLEGLAKAHALWAQALAFDAQDLEARAAEDPALEGEAARVRRDVERHARAALDNARKARRVGGENPTIELALADALRVSGQVRRARQRFMDAQRGLHPAPADLHRVAGLLAMDEANGDASAARRDAERAVETDPDLIRARLLLARALLADKETAAAREQIEAVYDVAEGHPRAGDLKRAIERGVPPAAPVVAVLDAGAPAGADAGMGEKRDAGAPDQASAEAKEEDDAQEQAPEGSAKAGVPSGRGYDWYVGRGEQLLERGSVGRAKQHFEAALERRSGGPEALAGLGYVALNQGSAAEAIRRFRPAASGGYADAYIGLGDAYRRAGRHRDALEAYQGYLDRRPHGPRATIARRQVRQLQSELGGTQTEPAAEGEANEGGGAPATPADTLPAPKGTEPDDLPPPDPPDVESD